MTGVFGHFLTDWEVKVRLRDHLQEWMPDYLPNARRHGEAEWGAEFSDFPLPASYTIVPRDPDRWAEDQLPAILVVSSGPTETMRRDGSGVYRGKFSIGVAAICSAGSEELTGLFADLYYKACEAILIDKPSLGGFAEGTIPGGPSDNAFLETSRDRTLASRFCDFQVTVDRILEVTGGPADHLVDPDTDPGDRPTVDTHELTLEKTA